MKSVLEVFFFTQNLTNIANFTKNRKKGVFPGK